MPNIRESVRLSKIHALYPGKWVALFRDEKSVAGVGQTIDEAVEAARKNGEDRPVLIKPPLRSGIRKAA